MLLIFMIVLAGVNDAGTDLGISLATSCNQCRTKLPFVEFLTSLRITNFVLAMNRHTLSVLASLAANQGQAEVGENEIVQWANQKVRVVDF